MSNINYYNDELGKNVCGLKARCKGYWAEIITTLAAPLLKAIQKRPHHVSCPVHGGKDGLRAFDDFEQTGGMICNTCGAFPDGIAVLMWVNEWSFPESIANIKKCLANTEKNGASFVYHENHDTDSVPFDTDKRKQALEQLSGELMALDAQEAEAGRLYLKKRGLTLDSLPSNLLFHPKLSYWENEKESKYPALVAYIDNLEGEYASLLRIYITEEGDKAPVGSPKKVMPAIYPGATKGASVHLYNPDKHLAVAEGLETALAVHQATSLPVWASVSAQGMKEIDIPDTVEEVSIWFDSDKSLTGEKAAYSLARRLMLAGKKVRLLKPPIPIENEAKSVDWLDVLVKD